MFADTMDNFNECEMASVMTSTVPLNPPMLWLVALPFMRYRPTVLAFIYA